MKLIIIGDGVDRERLEKLSAGLTVDFKGRLPQEQVQREVSQSKVAVAPSECWETFGLTAAESMTLGTPVVASNLGSLPTIVDGACGEIFEAGNEQALAAAIQRLLGREDYEEVCETCRKRVEERYSEEANYRQLMEIYSEK